MRGLPRAELMQASLELLFTQSLVRTLFPTHHEAI